MTEKSIVEYLEDYIKEKMDAREKLMIEFADAPGAMESQHDHTRQDIATEISVIDHTIQDIREAIYQFRHSNPDGNEIVQLGHMVEIEIDECSEKYLLLNGLGGITMGNLTTLSTDSPIGKAILGKRAGDTVKAHVPHGNLLVKIISVE